MITCCHLLIYGYVFSTRAIEKYTFWKDLSTIFMFHLMIYPILDPIVSVIGICFGLNWLKKKIQKIKLNRRLKKEPFQVSQTEINLASESISFSYVEMFTIFKQLWVSTIYWIVFLPISTLGIFVGFLILYWSIKYLAIRKLSAPIKCSGEISICAYRDIKRLIYSIPVDKSLTQ